MCSYYVRLAGLICEKQRKGREKKKCVIRDAVLSDWVTHRAKQVDILGLTFYFAIWRTFVLSVKQSVLLTISLVFFICMLPFHQVIVGFGLAPTTSQDSSYVLSADRGLFMPINFTQSGFTENKRNQLVYRCLK